MFYYLCKMVLCLLIKTGFTYENGATYIREFDEDFETGVWKVRKFVLPNASEYLWDIDNIRWAETGLINAFGSNRFFDEASQMIANSIFFSKKVFLMPHFIHYVNL